MVSLTVTERNVTGGVPEVCPPGFVARDAELARLAGALAGPPAVVLVEGEAGIGKSRLVREFLASPAGRRRRALVAACPPFRRPLTLGPVVDALRQATGNVAGLRLSALAGALRPLFPEWAAGLPPAPEQLQDASAARHRLFRALAELLDRLQVAVLVVEDVHWADEATLEFLLFLAARPPQRVSLLVTCRPEDVPDGSLLRRLSSRIPAGTTMQRVTLGPLDVAGTAELVSSMLPGGLVSAEFAAFLHAHTAGLPLAVEESVRLLRDRRDLRRRGGEWVRRNLDALAVPPTIRDAVLERAARLGPDALAILRAAAVLGESAEEPVVTAVAEMTGEAARAGVCEALGCGLLIENFPNGQGLVFRHPLTARAVYEAIPARQRREMHLRAARALEVLSPLPVARLARHFREAGATPGWVRYAEQAADLALGSGDETTAAALLHDLVTSAGPPARDVARLVNKIPLAALAEQDRYEDLARTLRSVADTGGLGACEGAEVRYQLGRLLVAMDDWNAAHAELERAVPHLARDPGAAVRAMVLLGWPIGQAGWPASRHLRWLRRAAEVTLPVGSADRLLLLVNRATALLLLGEEEGWAEAAKMPGDTSTAGDRLQVARGHLNVGEMGMLWGRYAEAGRLLATALELAEAHHYLRVRDAASATRVHLAWLTGAWDHLGERAAALAGDEDVLAPPRLEADLVAGLLAVAGGAAAGAEERFRVVLEETRRYGAVYRSMEAAGALARLHLLEDRADQALTLTDEPIRVITAKGIWLWATEVVPVRVEALAVSGGSGEAAKLVTAFARGLRGRDAPAPWAALAACRAILAEGRGEDGRAAGLHARAAEAWQALPRPYDALLARERQACCLLAAGKHDTGLALLTDVFQGLSGLGATGDAGRVAQRLRAHGVPARRQGRRGRRGYGDELSPSELDVVRLVAAGWTSRKIGEALSRSPRTVDGQLNSAMRKLGVSSRTALAVAAVESGLPPDDPHRLGGRLVTSKG